MRVAAWYHVYCAGTWRAPLGEHLSALARTSFDGPTFFGIVGPGMERAKVRNLLTVRIPGHVVCAQAPRGWEQETLDPLHDWAKANPDDAVLYAHTKGAAQPTAWNEAWRRSMTCALFGNLEANLAALEDGRDAVGCHWLTTEQFPGLIPAQGFPFFGGNFWLARCDYLARLPVCSRQSRHEAEAWIGHGDPKVVDLQPGWPGTTNCVTRIGWPK
jgi:hypothetical protein